MKEMTIERSNPTVLRVIAPMARLDPVDIVITDTYPGRGSITITCFGKAWTATWGSTGTATISEFFLSCNNDYLINCLCRGIDKYLNDPSNTSNAAFAKRYVLKLRKAEEISRFRARTYWCAIEDSDDVIRDCCDRSVPNTLSDLFGDDAEYAGWPTVINPDYAYLDRIVTVVKEALRSESESQQEDPEKVAMSMYIKRLASKLKAFSPDSEVITSSMKYLKDHGYINPLR